MKLSMIVFLILAEATIQADYAPPPGTWRQTNTSDGVRWTRDGILQSVGPGRYKYGPKVSLSSIEPAPPVDVVPPFTELDIWTPIPTEPTLLADLPPDPWPDPHPFPAPQTTDPTPPESIDLADIAPEPPMPDASSPIPRVIAGLAATAGVVLLGLWIANRGCSINSLKVQGHL
jgi:hypothetical protein